MQLITGGPLVISKGHLHGIHGKMLTFGKDPHSLSRAHLFLEALTHEQN
jgi:hypothetical protein